MQIVQQVQRRSGLLVSLGVFIAACSGSTDEPFGGGRNGEPGSGGSSGLATGGADPLSSGGAATVGSGGANQIGSSGGMTSTGSSGGGDGTAASGGDNSSDGSGGFTGSCTASMPVGQNASGSGPFDVVIETNADQGINEGTIFRPADLSGDELFPIFVWGQGGCSRDGLGARAAMAEIASHGYFVVADGDPDADEPNRDLGGGGDVLLAYVDWLLAENEKPCSAYYQSMEPTKIAANGFSCGGLMAADTAADPRMTTWGHTSSGSFSVNQAFYNSIHTPVVIITGTEDSLGAHENGQRDFDNISALGDIPVMMFAKVGADHGGDLWAANGGEFTQVNLAWLNWWLKGDETATGKGMLVGASCPFCSDNTWQIQSANLP